MKPIRNNLTKLLVMAGMVCAVLGTAGTLAHAGTLGVHIGSHHFPAQQYNNFNPGAYYIHDNGATVGTYYNSERRQSVYAGWTWDSGPWRLQVGAITGYERSAVLPMVVPSVAIGYGFRLTVLPKVERDGSAVIHFMWETKL